MGLHQEDLDPGLDLITQDSLDLRIVGHLMQTLVVMVKGRHLVSVVDHTLLKADSSHQPLEVLLDILLKYQLAVSTLQVRILEDFLLVLKVEDRQIITKVLLEDMQEASDYQDKMEGVLAIFLIEVNVEARDLFKIVSKEEWEEQLEAAATKEALVDILEEMGSQDKVEDQD